jgi:hypothetical protein
MSQGALLILVIFEKTVDNLEYKVLVEHDITLSVSEDHRSQGLALQTKLGCVQDIGEPSKYNIRKYQQLKLPNKEQPP